MEGAYYKENLYDINHLKSELDEIYELSTQIEKYTKTIHLLLSVVPLFVSEKLHS